MHLCLLDHSNAWMPRHRGLSLSKSNRILLKQVDHLVLVHQKLLGKPAVSSSHIKSSEALVDAQTVQHLFDDIVTSWTADLHVFQLLRVGINSDVLNFSILELVILKL